MVDANRPEIGFVFDVDDRASRQLDRIADQMERIDRAQRGIAGGAGRIGGQALADEYRGGAAGGAGGGGGYGQQIWSDNPEIRRLQQESDARAARERERWASTSWTSQDPTMRQMAGSAAYSDRDFERERIRHIQRLQDSERRRQDSEEQYARRKEERTKEWEQRETDRHKNQLERDRVRVREFEESQKRLRGHMYGSNFAGEFLAELGFVIFDQFQQGVQEYAADIDAQGYEYSGAGGELAGARRFQSRFGDLQRGMGEGVVAAGGALEDIFGPLFESGETTSRREFVEGIGRTREELERIAGIPRTDGMSALAALLEQINTDTLDPGALGAAVDELQRLGNLGVGDGAGLAGLNVARHGVISGGLEALGGISDDMRWGHLIQRTNLTNERTRLSRELQRATETPDSEFEQFIRQQQLAQLEGSPIGYSTRFDESQSGNLDKYLEQINQIAEAMQEAGHLTEEWDGNTRELQEAIQAATSDTKLAEDIAWEYNKAVQANNQRLAEAEVAAAEARKEYTALTLGFSDSLVPLDEYHEAMVRTSEALQDNEAQLHDHTNEVQHYRAELDYMRQSFGQFQQDSRDDLNLRLAAHLNGDIPLSPDDLDELNQKLRRLGELDSTQVDMIFNMKLNYSAVGAAQSELAGIAAGFGDPLAESGRSWMLNIGDTPTTNKSTGSGFGRSSGGGGSSKKTPEQAWIEERTKLLQDGATMAEVAALEMAFYADYDKEAWEKDYDQPGYLTEYGAGVKRINDRIQAQEDQADVDKEGYDALADIDSQIRDLRIKGQANKGMLDDFEAYESYQAQIEQLEKQKEILEEHLEQGTLTSETLANIEKQSEYWAERNQEALERMTDKVDEMKEELKAKFDETIKALNTQAAIELAGRGGTKPSDMSEEQWEAQSYKNAMTIELAFAQASLAEAQKLGDPAEIAKQQQRVAKVQANLQKANEELANARNRAKREALTPDERVRQELGDDVTDSSSQGMVTWTDPETGKKYTSDATNAYIRSTGITNLNSEEAIAIRRGINRANREQGADFTLGDSADASAEEALEYWTQSQSGSTQQSESSGATQVTINLGDGTTIQSSTAEVIVEEQG